MDAVPNVARRIVPEMQAPRLTNFYPTYDSANDQVDRIVPVRRAFFQPVVPRYRLSMSETRDQGLGPRFLDANVSAPTRTRPNGAERRTATEHGAVRTRLHRETFREEYRGRYIDLYA